LKYPNTKFTGMSMVSKTEISKAISAYYPNASQTGGAQRLALLKRASNLDELIDFCIDGYRAWGDAVLMGAGAYLKIGDYPTEIAEAKKYVKKEVYVYLTGSPFSSESDYDKWHENICVNLADGTKHFKNYSTYRKTSKDKFKNKSGFTIGNAQKFLNMLMKDLYACLSVDSTLLSLYEDYFKFCHMPLDSYILRFVDDIRYREEIKISARTYSWGNIGSYSDYMKEQNDIRCYVKKYNPSVTVLQTEFVIWPLYKE